MLSFSFQQYPFDFQGLPYQLSQLSLPSRTGFQSLLQVEPADIQTERDRGHKI